MNHGEIQKYYQNHIYLSYRNMGGAKKLVGDVVVNVFFVSDIDSYWTEGAKESYKQAHYSAMNFLMDDAKERGVTLRIRTVFDDVMVNMLCTGQNSHLWCDLAVKKYNSSVNAYQEYYKDFYNCNEAPIIFVLNKDFRSCASTADRLAQQCSEYAVISSDGGERAIVHELLHQFGACDFYYPKEVYNFLNSMNYKSIMADNVLVIDSLTAYAIGWAYEIDSQAIQILNKTSYMTREMLHDLIRREWSGG